MEMRALQSELQIARGQCLLRCSAAFGMPITAVPQLHRATAVLSWGNGSLEVAVIERMIFDFHGQPLIGGIVGRTACDSPGLEHSVEFQSEVEVKPACCVLLHHETQLV